MTHLRLFFIVAVLSAVGMLPAQEIAYHLTRTASPGGNGGWDYLTVDTLARRLYVSHSDHVVVLDADSLTVVGRIPNTNGVHGIAVASVAGHGFTSNGKPSTVTMFDLVSLAALKEIPVGKKPDAILYDAASQAVFVFNGGSNDATVIAAADGSVLGTIALGGAPEFGVTDGKGSVYVNLEDQNSIVKIDALKRSVTATWSIAPGEEPSGLAMDRAHRRLFSVCRNARMMVLDADNGRVIASLPIGSGTDGCAFDAGKGLAFSSNGEGTMTMVREVSPDSFVVAGTIPTRAGARTMTVDPVTHALYTAAASYGPAPAPTPEHPRPRPAMLPDSFIILKYQP